MTETKSAFQLAKEKASGVSSEETKEPGTALTVTPAEREVTLAERDHYEITVKLEEAAVQQFMLTQDISAMKPAHQLAFLQWEKKRLGVEGHCIDLLKNKTTNKVVPYYNDECAAQMKDSRGAKTAFSNYGTVEINGTTLAHVDCTMTKADGRTETRRAYLDITGVKGQDLGNALMKIETKAHRRSVLKGFGLSADSPEDGDGTIVRSLEGEAEPPKPSITDVFGQAGKPLLSAVQPTTATEPAAPETAETEQAEDVVEVESEAVSSVAPVGKPAAESSIVEPVAETSNSATPHPASEKEQSAPSEASQSGPQGEEPGKSVQTTVNSEETALDSATHAPGVGGESQEDDADFDALFGDDEDPELPDPEDLKIVTEDQLKDIMKVGKAAGWTPAQIAKEMAGHARVAKASEIPKYFTVGEYKKAIVWFSENEPGTEWPPVGEEAAAS